MIWIRRTFPPAAAPLSWREIIEGIHGWGHEKQARENLKKELGDYFKISNCWLVSSGKAALTLILKALHRLSPQKNSVVIPAYTCYSVPSCVIKAGLSVALSDIDAESLDFDYSQLESQLTEQTLCVVVNHLLGGMGDLDRCLSLAHSKGIWVVEDAAQAMGAFYRGNLAGTKGDVGFFSLGRGKVISAVEGGLIVTKNPYLATALQHEYQRLPSYKYSEKLSLLTKAIVMVCFLRPSLYWLPYHLPFLKLGQTEFSTSFSLKRMSGFQCGLMRRWKEKMLRLNQARLVRAQLYTRIFPPHRAHHRSTPFLRFPLIIKDPKQLDRLYQQARHLGLSRMYPDSLDDLAELKGQVEKGAFPAASKLAQTLLTLPTHPLISPADQKKIIRRLQGVCLLDTKNTQ